MKKFLVLYLAPASVLAAWMQKDTDERAAEEEKMRTEWNEWTAKHTANILETAGAGATTRVTTAGASQTKNEVMMYSLVEAESAEDAAKMFEGHPHLGIPEASIEIMAANPLTGM